MLNSLEKFLLSLVVSITLVTMSGANAYSEEKSVFNDDVLKMTMTVSDSNSALANHQDPPKKQIMHGIPPEAVRCNSGLKLIFKASDNQPACVKITSVDKLVQRGWAITQDWQYHD